MTTAKEIEDNIQPYGYDYPDRSDNAQNTADNAARVTAQLIQMLEQKNILNPKEIAHLSDQFHIRHGYPEEDDD